MGGTNGSRVNGGRGRAWAAPPKEAAGRASEAAVLRQSPGWSGGRFVRNGGLILFLLPAPRIITTVRFSLELTVEETLR